MNKNFKVNDFIFCEFELQQVVMMEDNKVTEVTNGFFRLSGGDLTDRCYPLNLDIKCASDGVKYWSKRFHELNHNSLNHPDLNRELIRRWVNICENIENKKVLKELYEDLDKFGNAVVNKVTDLKYEEIDGVRLFRR